MSAALLTKDENLALRRKERQGLVLFAPWRLGERFIFGVEIMGAALLAKNENALVGAGLAPALGDRTLAPVPKGDSAGEGRPYQWLFSEER